MARLRRNIVGGSVSSLAAYRSASASDNPPSGRTLGKGVDDSAAIHRYIRHEAQLVVAAWDARQWAFRHCDAFADGALSANYRAYAAYTVDRRSARIERGPGGA
jgi:hypothetical protein